MCTLTHCTAVEWEGIAVRCGVCITARHGKESCQTCRKSYFPAFLFLCSQLHWQDNWCVLWTSYLLRQYFFCQLVIKGHWYQRCNLGHNLKVALNYPANLLIKIIDIFNSTQCCMNSYWGRCIRFQSVVHWHLNSAKHFRIMVSPMWGLHLVNITGTSSPLTRICICLPFYVHSYCWDSISS